jgi:hypothetical protein
MARGNVRPAQPGSLEVAGVAPGGQLARSQLGQPTDSEAGPSELEAKGKQFYRDLACHCHCLDMN